jgi:hypothetical protein
MKKLLLLISILSMFSSVISPLRSNIAVENTDVKNKNVFQNIASNIENSKTIEIKGKTYYLNALTMQDLHDIDVENLTDEDVKKIKNFMDQNNIVRNKTMHFTVSEINKTISYDLDDN